jgi:hypothetical protein
MNTKAIRARLLHYLTDEVGRLVGLTPMELEQAAIGHLQLTDQQWSTLARRMQIGATP